MLQTVTKGCPNTGFPSIAVKYFMYVKETVEWVTGKNAMEEDGSGLRFRDTALGTEAREPGSG